MKGHVFLQLSSNDDEGRSRFRGLEPALVDQRLEAPRALEVVEWLLLSRRNLPDDGVRMLRAKWEGLSNQLVQDSPEGVDVGLLGGLAAREDARGLHL